MNGIKGFMHLTEQFDVCACSFCLDTRPKVRKRAQCGLADTLAAIQKKPGVIEPASAAVVMGGWGSN
jgi:hypothetical protein